MFPKEINLINLEPVLLTFIGHALTLKAVHLLQISLKKRFN